MHGLVSGSFKPSWLLTTGLRKIIALAPLQRPTALRGVLLYPSGHFETVPGQCLEANQLWFLKSFNMMFEKCAGQSNEH